MTAPSDPNVYTIVQGVPDLPDFALVFISPEEDPDSDLLADPCYGKEC